MRGAGRPTHPPRPPAGSRTQPRRGVEGFTAPGAGPLSTWRQVPLRTRASRDRGARAGSPAASRGQTAQRLRPVLGSGPVVARRGLWAPRGYCPKGVAVSAPTPGSWEHNRVGTDGQQASFQACGVAPRLTRWYGGGRGRWLAGRGHRCPQTSAAGTPRSRAWLAALQRLSGPGAHLLKQSRGP